MRHKTPGNKEYAIRITHPEFGVLYFYYRNDWGSWKFTKNINQVRKWKTEKFAYNLLKDIISHGHIELVLSKTQREFISDREHLYDSYAIINASAKKQVLFDFYKDTINNINDSFKTEGFNQYLFKQIAILNSTEKEVAGILRTLDNTTIKGEAKRIKLDIIDASFNFRKLKMKTLADNLSDDKVEI